MRSKPAPKRSIPPDTKYHSPVVAKFINYVMRRGKKSVAQRVVYDAFAEVAEKAKRPALEVFEEAVKRIAPVVEVKSRRVGGSNYQIPIEVRGERRQSLAFRWLILAAQTKRGKPMAVKLADEIMLASQGQGDAVKKREDVHRMAEANRAFAHFA